MRGQSVAKIDDLCAGPIMLALAFGRFGCFLNGCCYGRKGEGFPYVRFPDASPAAREGHNPALPTQLFEVAAAVGFFFLLSWLYRRKRKFEGEVFLVMVMLYAGWRFMIEFVRGDERPVWIASLSYSQVVSLVALAGAAVWFFLKRSGSAEPPAPAPAAPKA